MSRDSTEPPTKKRKRLTGSQKKARKAAKLANNPTASSSTAYQTGKVLNPNHDSKKPAREEDEEVNARSQSPDYEPQSPNLAQTSLPDQPSNATSTNDRHIPPHLIPNTAVQSNPAQPANQAPSSSSTLNGGASNPVPRPPAPSVVLSKLLISFPSPPPITPLTGQEPALEPETSESLLESALWSWYTAVRLHTRTNVCFRL
jgi:hypothetical protein